MGRNNTKIIYICKKHLRYGQINVLFAQRKDTKPVKNAMETK